jgi:hypothetical protein
VEDGIQLAWGEVRRRLAIIAHSGVGKSALLDELRSDPRLAGKCIIELDAALPAWFDPVLARSLDGTASDDYWFWAKMAAARAALAERPDVLAGVFSEGKIRAMLEARRFSFVVLSLPRDVHRARLSNRSKRTGYFSRDLERVIEGQKRLEGLGYELIDADRPPKEIAVDVAKKLLDD